MKEIFDEILATFENEDIKTFATKCIDAAPPYWHSVPSSSTGKYHPQYALGDGGLVRHTLALVRILNHMFGVESIANQFTSRERDLLRTAGIAHDMMKSGTQEDYEKSKWTKFDHPLLAARMVYDMDGLNKDERKYIATAISSHMGQWNSDKRHPNIVLPKPEDKSQIILHLADYLASRKDIEIKFDNLPETKEELPDINTWIVRFGKYKDAGLTLPQIAEKDPGYIAWARNNVSIEPAKSLLKTM